MEIVGEQTPKRHPWLAQFEEAPKAALSELLSGYANIHPYERLAAPEAAKVLFGSLAPSDGARVALGSAILDWLTDRRNGGIPTSPPKLQRYIREVCEALEIVSLLKLNDAATALRQQETEWTNWTTTLVISPGRDALSELLRTFANTQHLVTTQDQSIKSDEITGLGASL